MATSLFRFAMPAIRYKLHDYAVPTDEKCECGRGLPLLEALEGRRVDCLIATNGELVSPFRMIVALQDTEQVGRYQVIQDRRDRVTIKIESQSGIPPEGVEKVIGISKSLLGSEMEVAIDHVSKIEPELGLKFHPVICKVRKGI